LGDELDDLFSLRLVVEATGILLTVPTLDGSEAGLLLDLVDDMDRYAGRRDHRSLAVADRAFHLGLVAGGGVRMRSLAEDLAHRAERHCQVHLSRGRGRRASLREHRQILARALEQDVEGCVQGVAEHHLRTVSELINELDPGHPLERVRIAALQITGHQISALDAE
jgi:DNA-binding GntR family transcriptional regulator